MYVIDLYDGYYLEERGGNDWGRAEYPSHATHYDSREQAEQAIERLRPYPLPIVSEWDGGAN